MRPRHLADEVLEEQRGGDRARAAAGVVGVGDPRGDLVLVGRGERHPPHRLTRGRPGVEQRGGQRVVVGEQAADLLTQRDLDGAGERGDVDEHGGVELGDGVGQGVGHDQAALGVGVGDLGGPTAPVPDHVAGAQRVAAETEFSAAATSPMTGHRAADGGQRGHGGDHDATAGHVALHVDHRLAGLDGEAAGVEGDALADQHHRRRTPRERPAAAWRVVEADQARRVGRGLADAEDAAEALLGRAAPRPRPCTSRPASPAAATAWSASQAGVLRLAGTHASVRERQPTPPIDRGRALDGGAVVRRPARRAPPCRRARARAAPSASGTRRSRGSRRRRTARSPTSGSTAGIVVAPRCRGRPPRGRSRHRRAGSRRGVPAPRPTSSTQPQLGSGRRCRRGTGTTVTSPARPVARAASRTPSRSTPSRSPSSSAPGPSSGDSAGRSPAAPGARRPRPRPPHAGAQDVDRDVRR